MGQPAAGRDGLGVLGSEVPLLVGQHRGEGRDGVGGLPGCLVGRREPFPGAAWLFGWAGPSSRVLVATIDFQYAMAGPASLPCSSERPARNSSR